MSSESQSLAQAKQALRTPLRAKRWQHHSTNPNAANRLRDLFLSHVKVEEGSIIAGYHPFRGEMNPLPLLNALRERGHDISLPVVGAPQTPLLFRRWTLNLLLLPNRMGIAEPPPDAPEVTPDLVLAPLLAFDSACHRLGYGGGFYDRTLATLRIHQPTRAIGLGFAMQQIDRVPVGPHDITLDQIVTELNVF